MKSVLKLGSIALALPLMLAPLCQAQQWSAYQDLGGVPNSVPFGIQVPGTNILQIFYQGTDNGLWTRWRNTDGSWSSEVTLGGQLYSATYSDVGGFVFTAPIAIQLPGTNILQVFYRGSDNALWTLWRNTDGSWSSMQRLGGQLGGDPAVTLIPGTNTVQVFYQGTNHQMYTRWLTNGTWSSEQGMGGSLFTQTCDDVTNPSCYGTPALPVPIQIPNTNDLEVFYRGSNNHLQAFRRNPDASWTSQDFGGNLASDPSAAPVPGTNQIEVFYQGGGGCTWTGYDSAVTACEASGGNLMTQWGNLSSWTNETQMAGQLESYFCYQTVDVGYETDCDAWGASYSTPKAYTQPGTNNLYVLYRGWQGNAGQERTPDGTWQSEFSLYSVSESDVAWALVPGTNTMEIFYVGLSLGEQSADVTTQWTQ